MKGEMHIKNMSELALFRAEGNEMREKLTCGIMGQTEVITHFSTAVYPDALMVILVLSGSGTAYINYESYVVEADTILVLSPSHLFHFCHCTSDFGCRCLIVSKEFMEEMDSIDMIHKRTKYGVKLYHSPVMSMNHARAKMLAERIDMVEQSIDNMEHYYYKECVLNRLSGFYLDLSDVIERCDQFRNESNPLRYESTIKSFIELLVKHYREEHKVEFYASCLHLSTHYLTQMVKQVTGQSVSNFIFEMLYSEARNLLMHSELSVQEIAAALNFSDQSSFGKFFKRKAGVSPIDFRRLR